MKEAKTYKINMKPKAMRDYVIRTHYSSMAGKIAIFMALYAMALFIISFGKEGVTTSYKVMLIGVVVVVAICNPLGLTLKAYNQVKINPVYKKPLEYTFSNIGISISQGEQSEEIPWNKIYKIIKTKYILAIYTSKVHAFVIPLEELGDDLPKIAATVVQCTEEYRPILSKNLKELKSGKGVKRIK